MPKVMRTCCRIPALLRYSEHVQGQGPAFFNAASEHTLEGIVSKRMDSTYFQGRTRSWLKLKFTKSDEFIVVGFTRAKGSHRRFGGLLLGSFDGGRLTFAGRVGTGFTDQALTTIGTRLEGIRKHESTSAVCRIS
jgi:bifunctional non-homologous end joining protein LigD